MIRQLLLLVLGALPGLLVAGELSISGDPCGDNVVVRADDVALSELLKKLSEHGGFAVKFDPQADRRISVDREDSIAGILRNVMAGRTLLLMEDVIPRCGDHVVVSEAWILPHGDDVDYVEFAAPGLPDEAESDEPRKLNSEGRPLPHGLRRQAGSDEEFRKLKEEAKAGDLVAHPDTGEPISREEYDRLMKARGEHE